MSIVEENITNLSKENENLKIGDNKPYSGRLRNDTLYKHATSRGLPHLLIEIKQDLSRTEKQILINQIKIICREWVQLPEEKKEVPLKEFEDKLKEFME